MTRSLHAGDIDTLVFSAGGVRALVAHTTVLEELTAQCRLDLATIRTVVGTSAGALIALCVALRMPVATIREECATALCAVNSIDFHVTNLVYHGGYGCHDVMCDLIGKHISKALLKSRRANVVPDNAWLARVLIQLPHARSRECIATTLCLVVASRVTLASFAMDAPPPNDGGRGVTFAELHVRTGVRLRVVASDVERARVVTFSHETTPKASVASAVAASMAIPLVFSPVRVALEPGRDCALCIDGAIYDPFPLGTSPDGARFDPPLDPRRTIGISLCRTAEKVVGAQVGGGLHAEGGALNVSAYAKSLATMLLHRLDTHVDRKDFFAITVPYTATATDLLFTTMLKLNAADRALIAASALVAAREQCKNIEALERACDVGTQVDETAFADEDELDYTLDHYTIARPRPLVSVRDI